MPERASYIRKRFWNVMDAYVRVSFCMGTPSLGIQVLNVKSALGLSDSIVSELNGALLFIDCVVGALFHGVGDLSEALIVLLPFGYGTRDDERGAGLINENRVALVHNGVVVTTLNNLWSLVRGVVAKIVETKFVVGSVRDVSCIRFLF